MLTKLNELAERYGIKCYEFGAIVRLQETTSKKTGFSMALEIQEPVDGNPTQEKRFEEMLSSAGFQNYALKGDPDEIIDALDNALAKAPRRRPR